MKRRYQRIYMKWFHGMKTNPEEDEKLLPGHMSHRSIIYAEFQNLVNQPTSDQEVK